MADEEKEGESEEGEEGYVIGVGEVKETEAKREKWKTRKKE